MNEPLESSVALALCLLTHIAGQLTLISTRADVSDALAHHIYGQFETMAEAVRELVANG